MNVSWSAARDLNEVTFMSDAWREGIIITADQTLAPCRFYGWHPESLRPAFPIHIAHTFTVASTMRLCPHTWPAGLC